MDRWEPIHKSLYLVRRVEYKGVKYNVFFEYLPTLFKSRGRYHSIDINNKEVLGNLLNVCSNHHKNFELVEGEVKSNVDVPEYSLGEDEYSQYYLYLMNPSMDNTKQVVEDLYDFMDYVALYNPKIVFRPKDNEGNIVESFGSKLTNFKIKDEVEYLTQPIENFKTSSDKLGLSYGFSVAGTELSDESLEITKHRYVAFPIVNSLGEVIINEIELKFETSQVPQLLETITQFIGEYVIGMDTVKDGVFIKFDISKFKPANSIIEYLPLMDTINEREQVRLNLKVLKMLKETVKDMAQKAGVPVNSKYYSYQQQVKTKHSSALKIEYKTESTKYGAYKAKDVLNLGGLKNNLYIGKLIEIYINEGIEMDKRESTLKEHIVKSLQVTNKEILNKSFSLFFTSIQGIHSLTDMFLYIERLISASEVYSNSLKIKCLPLNNGLDLTNYVYRLYMSGINPNETRKFTESSDVITMNDGNIIKIDVEVNIDG